MEAIMSNKYYNLELLKYLYYKLIFIDNSECRIWKRLDNGCSIGTLGYSENNIQILYKLLQSFSEQYGEVIDYEAAKEELELYMLKGKLFIYFDQYGNPVSMNGCTYNEDNISVDFITNNGLKPTNLYFYGLSTIPSYRGKGACRELIKFAIEYAKYNNFDLVYARTDLTNSNSEWLMKRAGMEICTYDNKILAEWVNVTEDTGDYRLHLWLPLKDNIYLMPSKNSIFATNDEKRSIIPKEKIKEIK